MQLTWGRAYVRVTDPRVRGKTVYDGALPGPVVWTDPYPLFVIVATPFAVAIDVVTSPIQLLAYLLFRNVH
jgi:hypothetical protein